MKGHYVENAPKTAMRWHSMKMEECRALFIAVGWVGERRQPAPVVRLAPYFDIGPGPDVGR